MQRGPPGHRRGTRIALCDVFDDDRELASKTGIENWRDTVAVSIGADDDLAKEPVPQGGVGHDRSPVTDSNHASLILDSDHYLVSFGARYHVPPILTL